MFSTTKFEFQNLVVNSVTTIVSLFTTVASEIQAALSSYLNSKKNNFLIESNFRKNQFSFIFFFAKIYFLQIINKTRFFPKKPVLRKMKFPFRKRDLATPHETLDPISKIGSLPNCEHQAPKTTSCFLRNRDKCQFQFRIETRRIRNSRVMKIQMLNLGGDPAMIQVFRNIDYRRSFRFDSRR